MISWLKQPNVTAPEGTEIPEAQQKEHSWWKVMCLTGVGYYSTLGYLPAIAIGAQGAGAPIAMLFIVLLTLAGMIPIYRVIARQSPHGQGSVHMLEHILDFWPGKLLVLALLGFIATAWFITITLSTADATVHLIENPFFPESLNYPVVLTLIFILGLGAVFLKGFEEAISIAIVLVVIYLSLNLVIVVHGTLEIIANPILVSNWKNALLATNTNWIFIVLAAFLAFPQLALGISGFETGVGMMPLVRNDNTTGWQAAGEQSETAADDKDLSGRVRNTNKMLLVAALIMAFFLISTSLVATLLIPAIEFQEGGQAVGRALAFVAYRDLGNLFGTIYDISTIAILWFAGASAMAGLLNIVPRYLPRYGMAPDWARLTRPLVILNTFIACSITFFFQAEVDAQAGAYAIGVLAMMLFGTLAVFLYARKAHNTVYTWISGITFLVVFYAITVNEFRQPEGILIALGFAGGIIIVSFISRFIRVTELRTRRIILDEKAFQFLLEADTDQDQQINIIAHRPQDSSSEGEYGRKERQQRMTHHLTTSEKVLFLEIEIKDASEFSCELYVQGVQIGKHRVLKGIAPSVPNAIAAFLLHAQIVSQKQVHCYFDWTEGNPFLYLFKYLLFGQGETAPVTREILREAESDSEKRPRVHVG